MAEIKFRLLFLLTVFCSFFGIAATAATYLTEISVDGWLGGGVDNSGDGTSDFCQIARDAEGGGSLLAIWFERGLVLALSSPRFQMMEGDPHTFTVTTGNWSGTVGGEANDAETFFALVGTHEELLEGLKSGVTLSAKGDPGEFLVHLPNGREAFQSLENCYLTEVAGLQPKYVESGPVQPSEGRGADVSRALRIMLGDQSGTPEEAFALVDRAAETGDRDARWLTGQMILAGYGTDMSRELGLARILSAAEAGHPEALTFLATEYLAVDDPVTRAVGREYLERAASQSHAPAIVALRLLQNGDAR